MTEPTHEVNVAQVLQILGAKEVEIQMQRMLIAQLRVELAAEKKARAEGIPPDGKPENVVPIKEPA